MTFKKEILAGKFRAITDQLQTDLVAVVESEAGKGVSSYDLSRRLKIPRSTLSTLADRHGIAFEGVRGPAAK